MLAMIMMVYTGSKSCINITTNPHTLSMDWLRETLQEKEEVHPNMEVSCTIYLQLILETAVKHHTLNFLFELNYVKSSFSLIKTTL